MLINIANTPKYKFIEEETVKISNDLGFKQEETNTYGDSGVPIGPAQPTLEDHFFSLG